MASVTRRPLAGCLLFVVAASTIGVMAGLDGLRLATELLVVAVEALALTTWLTRRRLAGADLLVVRERLPHRSLGFLTVLVFLVSDFEATQWSLPSLLLLVMGTMLLPYSLLESRIGTRFTEEGVLQASRFIPWRSIRSYHWLKGRLYLSTAPTLLPWWITGGGGLIWARPRHDERSGVTALLSERLPNRGRASLGLSLLLRPLPEADATRLESELLRLLSAGREADAVAALVAASGADHMSARFALRQVRQRLAGSTKPSGSNR